MLQIKLINEGPRRGGPVGRDFTCKHKVPYLSRGDTVGCPVKSRPKGLVTKWSLPPLLFSKKKIIKKIINEEKTETSVAVIIQCALIRQTRKRSVGRREMRKKKDDGGSFKRSIKERERERERETRKS